MRPQLYIMKMKRMKGYSLRKSIRIAVIDGDIEQAYPANFLCILPQHVSTTAEESSVFAKIFGEKRIELAKKLLAEAIETEGDSETKTEMRERLKLLQPKSALHSKYRF